ncbi:hypothetical protein KIF24_21180 [Micromonospora sp. Llam7]|uniref:hypothetical protein n=1 Tax=Micromonospora tarapacensis TaxID=2835305 RepID=UPI001C82F5C3|nr:hypothetical protein [Micromonospora tarapacensis]MBX7268287.1 hypothetical protein [Micromonospora tarapacensis]
MTVEDLPEIDVDSRPELLVLVGEGGGGPAGWAMVLPGGDFWMIRNATRSMVHGSSLSTLTGFWATVLGCEVGRPRLAEPSAGDGVRG